MSAIRSPSPTSTPSNFEAIFITSIDQYSKQTKKDLRKHPLASKTDARKSAEEILAIFRDQAKEFSDVRNGDPKLIKCLEPIVSGLYSLSTSPVLGTAVSLVSSRNLFCFPIFFLTACRCSPLHQQSFLESVSLYLSVLYQLALLIFGIPRRQSLSRQATTL